VNVFIRIIVAVFVYLIVMALLPPLFRVFTVPLDADLFLIIRLCGAGVAVFYVLSGPGWSWPWPRKPS
jgi:hypothetical protein